MARVPCSSRLSSAGGSSGKVSPSIARVSTASQAIVPLEMASGMAQDVGGETSTNALVLTGGVDRETETAIEEAVGGAQSETSVYVERGYQRPPEATIVLLVLGVLGGVLMLGGTLTATFLALADARPDLATLPRRRASPPRTGRAARR